MQADFFSLAARGPTYVKQRQDGGITNAYLSRSFNSIWNFYDSTHIGFNGKDKYWEN